MCAAGVPVNRSYSRSSQCFLRAFEIGGHIWHQVSAPLAIGHRSDNVAIIDATRERRPPFSPEDVVAEFAALLKVYRISKVIGDRYGGEWPRERFRESGIAYEPAAKPKSELCRDLLPAINSRQLDLLDDPRLVAQIVGLERRTARGGRDIIDHAPGGHDDLCNAVAGVVAELIATTSFAGWGVYEFTRRLAGEGGEEIKLPSDMEVPADWSLPSSVVPSVEYGFSFAPKKSAGLVTVKVPRGVSNIYGRSGTAYMVRGGVVQVSPEDAEPLLGQEGFERVA